MAGIYLHIPFCKQACTYCNFHFTTSLHYKDKLVNALMREAEAEKDYLLNEPVQTIYFGGGTPSLLTTTDCEKIMNAIYRNFTISTNVECTIEANPDDINSEKLKGWKGAGVNRLSIGVQSFQEKELQWMNRAHNAEQSIQCIELSRQNGFENFSIDLIYGSPLLTDDQWKENVSKALSFQIPHLSCYALTVEEKTPLYKNIMTNSVRDVNTDQQANQFLLLMQWMRENGYEHYEVSNFARPGHRCRHNEAYWTGLPYFAAGPGAARYIAGRREMNHRSTTTYIQRVLSGQSPVAESEELAPEDHARERLVFALRRLEGISPAEFEQETGYSVGQLIAAPLARFIAQGLFDHTPDNLRLTRRGLLVSDALWPAFLTPVS